MNTINGTINDDYGWEVTVFHKIREASDGIIFIDGKINWHRYLADLSGVSVIDGIVVRLNDWVFTNDLKKIGIKWGDINKKPPVEIEQRCSMTIQFTDNISVYERFKSR